MASTKDGRKFIRVKESVTGTKAHVRSPPITKNKCKARYKK